MGMIYRKISKTITHQTYLEVVRVFRVGYLKGEHKEQAGEDIFTQEEKYQACCCRSSHISRGLCISRDVTREKPPHEWHWEIYDSKKLRRIARADYLT